MTSNPPAGWYPDPSGTPGQRWWNGTSWSDATQAVATAPDSYGQPAPYPTNSPYGATPNYGGAPNYGGGPGYRRMRRGRMASNYTGTNPNHYAFITFAIAAAYIVLALATGFAIFGVIPFLMSLRSQRRREPLAPFAIAAAVAAIIVSISVIAGR